jgi:hypothetical protein
MRIGANIKTGELLRQRLELIYHWYQGMVNPHTGMFEYLYLPQQDSMVQEQCPIRDLGSVWDVELFGEFLHRHDLEELIRKSLQHYKDYLMENDGYLILNPNQLEEPSSIAHSAFMILMLLNAPEPRANEQIVALAEGILQQQRRDGSYKVYFEDLPDQGEELYAGEAMLALLETHRQFPDEGYLQSAEQSFAFYDSHYFQRGRVGEDLLIFFANWQSQAARCLFEQTNKSSIKTAMADYLVRLHDRIIDKGFYSDVERHPDRQVSVEIACALEGLNDAFAILQYERDPDRTIRYEQFICTGLNYLLKLQCTKSGATRERGGFGISFSERAQRIDITGHAASAFMKSVQNGIECESLED